MKNETKQQQNFPTKSKGMFEQEVVNKINNEVWTKLAPSKIQGIGVFAIRNIPEGTELFKSQNEIYTYYKLSNKNFLKLLEPIRNIILDRTQFERIRFRHPNCSARLQSFMNHSNNPNSDGKKALRMIYQGEEITKNYMETKKLHPYILKRYYSQRII